MQKEYFSNSEEDTYNIASSILNEISTFQKPIIVFLHGEVGAGKTFFTKCICESFNLKDEITSPSFSIINEYNNDNIRIAHIDFYRINDYNELEYLGIEDVISENDLILIEWPEHSYGYFDNYKNHIDIFINKTDKENERIIILKTCD